MTTQAKQYSVSVAAINAEILRMPIRLLKKMKILPKILAISLLSVVLIDAIILCYFLPRIEQNILEREKISLRELVEVAYGLIVEYDNQVKQELMPMYEARIRAAADIRSLRYGDKEYFWINDTHHRMVMHPIKPELEGKDLTDYQDPKGTFLFRDFVRVSTERGNGFVSYLWPKPGETTAVNKISYVKLFQPWGWIIGSGIYVDDVKREIGQLRSEMILGSLLFAILSFAIAWSIGRGITNPVQHVVSGLQSIASGRENSIQKQRIVVDSEDEIGLLSAEFNRLMDSISKIALFKQVIEEDESLNDVYTRLGRVFEEDLGLQGVFIFESDSSKQNMLLPAYPPAMQESELCCNPEIMTNAGLCKASKTGHAICSLDYPNICRQFTSGSSKEHSCFPITAGGGAVGVVQFILDRSPDNAADITDWQERIRKANLYLKESLSVIETKRLMGKLMESALIDPLTGLHNRRFLKEALDKHVAGVIRRNSIMGLIICDLDFFKQVNDQYGHDAGDAVLRETADIIRKSVRDADLVVRFGGEEFLVLLIDVEAEATLQVAEKIRANIEAARFKVSGGSISKTISLGISEFPVDTGIVWQAIKFADVALYQAKEGGRNRSIRFTADMWTEQQF